VSAELRIDVLPNPSDGRTTVRFSLPRRAEATLTIHDAAGRLVREPARGVRGDGWHAVTWDGRDRRGHDVASGVYFGRLVVRLGDRQDVSMRKIVVAR
jgi:flagellar hook assembly protein FlgD